jgi:hypothetical protein
VHFSLYFARSWSPLHHIVERGDVETLAELLTFPCVFAVVKLGAKTKDGLSVVDVARCDWRTTQLYYHDDGRY